MTKENKYLEHKKDEMDIFFRVMDFRNTSPYKNATPILDSLKKKNVDLIRFKEFLDLYGNILEHGVAFEAIEFQRSNIFPEVKTVPEAFNQGHNCFNGFLKRIYNEFVNSRTEKTEEEQSESMEGVEDAS